MIAQKEKAYYTAPTVKAHEIINYFYQNSNRITGHLEIISPNPGKKTIIFGGTHGNEPSGVKAIVKAHQLLTANPDIVSSGEIHFILGNPEAFIQNVRFIDQDLNRVFHQPKGNSVEALRGREIIKLFNVIGPIDCILDLHTVSKGDYQIMIYDDEQENALENADQFSAIDMHLIYNKSHIQGLLIERAKEHGAKVRYAVECGNHIDPNSEKVAYNKILSFLLFNKNIKTTAENLKAHKKSIDKAEITQFRIIEPIIPEENFHFVDQDIYTGKGYKKGQIYAKSSTKTYIAEDECYVVMPPQKVQPDDFDAGFICSKKIIHRK